MRRCTGKGLAAKDAAFRVGDVRQHLSGCLVDYLAGGCLFRQRVSLVPGVLPRASQAAWGVRGSGPWDGSQAHSGACTFQGIRVEGLTPDPPCSPPT